MFRFAVDLFCSTLKQVTKRDFEYRCNKADIAAWDNFIDTFGDRVGENFIRDLITYNAIEDNDNRKKSISNIYGTFEKERKYFERHD